MGWGWEAIATVTNSVMKSSEIDIVRWDEKYRQCL